MLKSKVLTSKVVTDSVINIQLKNSTRKKTPKSVSAQTKELRRRVESDAPMQLTFKDSGKAVSINQRKREINSSVNEIRHL